MGGSISAAYIRTNIEQYFDISTVNEMITRISLILHAENSVIIKNVAHVRGLKFNFFNDVKNQLVVKEIMTAASEYELFDQINEKLQVKTGNWRFFRDQCGY